MVELQDEGIGLTAVSARMFTEEGYEIGGTLSDERVFASNRVLDVALAIGFVMLSFVGGSAGSTVVVSLTLSLSTPREV
jgi:hypothetical protein